MATSFKLPISQGFGETNRIDRWWMEPLWMGVALTAALVYTFLRLIFFDGAIHYDDHRVTSPIFLSGYNPPVESGSPCLG